MAKQFFQVAVQFCSSAVPKAALERFQLLPILILVRWCCVL